MIYAESAVDQCLDKNIGVTENQRLALIMWTLRHSGKELLKSELLEHVNNGELVKALPFLNEEERELFKGGACIDK